MARISMTLTTLAVAAVLTGCATDSTGSSVTSATRPQSATGVVVAIDGDLSSIDAFSILLADGSVLELNANPGLLFDDEGPLSHIQDHLLSGTPVAVEFHDEADSLVATAVGDAE